jgi:GAF domain
MKNNALRKETLFLLVALLIISSLLVYTIPSLLKGDRKSYAAYRLDDLMNKLRTTAHEGWVRKQEGKTVDTQKEVSDNVASMKSLLSDLYKGETKHPILVSEGIVFERPQSEDRKALIKLAVVSIEKLEDKIKAGNAEAGTQFDEVKTTIQHVVKDYVQEAAASWSRLVLVAWITLFLTLAFFVGLIVVVYVKLKAYYSELSKTQNRVTEELQRVEQLSNFIEAMASGNYDMQIEAKAEDELSATLVSMRDKLKNNSIEEQRRNWSTTGLAKIGEILRSTGNSSELYDSVIKFLVKYTNSNQGGLFIIDDKNDQQHYLDMVACYAFERKKFLTKKIEVGSGLVGQCFLEKEKIHLTEIPEEYVRITSGLGGDKPNSCLLVPLKTNDKVFGVIELASFQLYSEHVVNMVEQLAESVASTISTVKINESTRVLLEQTQQQAEEMKSQEEEMRQNMEELSATQEEMHRKEREYINRISELESQLGLVEKV